MPFIEVHDGTRLHYADWGSGKPLLLIHGWAIGAAMWEYQIPSLIASGIRCIVYDQRGCGRSDHPSQGYEFSTLADDLAILIERLDLNAVTLAGWSLGGGVVARYLARHGGARVARSILISTNTPFLLKGENNPEGLDRSLIYDPFIAGLLDDRPQLLAKAAPLFFGAPVSPEIIGWAIGLSHTSSAVGMLQLFKAVHETDFRPDMAAFTMPTLIVHGSADPFQPLEATSERSHRAIPGSRLETYEGASHGLFFTHRERLNADLLEFIGEDLVAGNTHWNNSHAGAANLGQGLV
jgi:non-heme chloroperoxidase